MTKPTPCFVIMPFSQTTDKHTEEYWTANFENFLKPTIEEISGLEACRSEPLRGDIIKEIIKELAFCPVAIADLTDLNANVFWELGVRQSFRHGTVTIAEEGTKIPFDVGFKGTLFYYPKDHIKNAQFRKKFKKAIKDCLSNPDRPDSHVLESITGRGTLFQIFHRDETIRRVRAVEWECKANSTIEKKIYETMLENQKEPNKRSFITALFLTSAIELLFTTRYLDETEEFYGKVLLALNALKMKNNQLMRWQNDPDGIEKNFLKPKARDNFNKRIGEFAEEIKKVMKKLETSC